MDDTAEKTQLELYKRALELAKSTFQLAESIIKTIEEKGRNNITLTPTVLGFMVVILRPDSVATKFNWTNAFQILALFAFALAVICVIWSYVEFQTIVRPIQARQVDSDWIVELPKRAKLEVDSVVSELYVFKVYIDESQNAIKQKGRALNRQTIAMIAMIIFVAAYLIFSVLHLAK
jgi:uncharacterized membrane protein (DUF373 family)